MENNKFFIIIPLYSDWKALWKLIYKIEKNIYNLNAEFYVIVVNDASTIKRPNIELNLNKIKSVKILNMKNNVLSGRCIATGLEYMYDKEEFDYIIMTNRAEEDRDNNTLANTKTCFEKFRDEDLVSVKRNGLMLSTIRKLK